MSLLLGYNTNGFAHHRLDDALVAIAECGYRSVGLTIDVHHAPLESTDFDALNARLRELDLLPVVETGARFYLDPRAKHQPTLIHDPDGKRLGFLLGCIEVARAIGAPCVSLWSGAATGAGSGSDSDWNNMVDGLRVLCDRADAAGVDLAFEPEPGMLVDTMARFEELRKRVAHPRLCLTLDVGHLWCLESDPPEAYLERYAELLRNVHLDDHRRGVHDHLFFGEGEMEFAPILETLRDIGAERDLPATVELSRHSHDAIRAAKGAIRFLAELDG